MLHITSSYPSSDVDPRGIFVQRIARGQRDQGVDVRVLAPGAPGLPDKEFRDGMWIHRASYWFGPSQNLTRGLAGIAPNLRERPWLFPQLVSLTAALARMGSRLGEEHDIIHAHWLYPGGIAGMWAARQTGRPLVVTSHGGDLNLAMRSSILGAVSRRVAHAADACVAVSDALGESFLRLEVPSSRVSVIPYGVELCNASSESPMDPALASYSSIPGLRVLYVGSLIPRKSVQTLLEAHSSIAGEGRAITTMIVGTGPLEQSLMEFASEHSLKGVLFAGEQPPSSIPHFLRASHALVLPSLSEGRPNVVLEAMAQGRLVIASDIPGTREMIEEGKTGMLFPPGDAAALAACIRRLLEDNQRIEEMGMRASQEVKERGSLADNAKQHIALYTLLLSGMVNAHCDDCSNEEPPKGKTLNTQLRHDDA